MDHDLLHLGMLAASAAALVIGCFDGDGRRRSRVVACDSIMVAAMLGAILAPGSSVLALVVLVAGAFANAAMVGRAARTTGGGGSTRHYLHSLAMILMAGLVVATSPSASRAAPAEVSAHSHGDSGSLTTALVGASAVLVLLSIGAARACFRAGERRSGAHHASMGVAMLFMGAGMLG